MIDKKIIELEEKIAFLQNMLDDLNMVVFRHGETIDKLNVQIKETNEKSTNQNLPSSGESRIIDDKPPHF